MSSTLDKMKASFILLALIALVGGVSAQSKDVKCSTYGRNNFGCDLSRGLCCMSPYQCIGGKDLKGMVTCALPPTSGATTAPGTASTGTQQPQPYQAAGRKLQQSKDVKCSTYGKNNFGCDLSKGLCCMSPYQCIGGKDLKGMVTCALPPSGTTRPAPEAPAKQPKL